MWKSMCQFENVPMYQCGNVEMWKSMCQCDNLSPGEINRIAENYVKYAGWFKDEE